MKNKSIIFLSVLFFIVVMPEAIMAQSESVINGGFETGSLSPWVYVGAGVTPPPDMVTSTEALNGEFSLRIGGYTLCIVKQDFSPSVVSTGVLSFWVLVPSVIDPCIFPDEYCTPGFSLSVKYSDSQEDYNLVGQLTGSGWKRIEISVSQSDEIQSIIFTTAEINDLYIDDVSLQSETSDSKFPWGIFLLLQ